MFCAHNPAGKAQFLPENLLSVLIGDTMNLAPGAPTRITNGIQFFDDLHHDDNAMSRIPSPSVISKFEQSSASFMATNLFLDQHEVHHHSTSPSQSDWYPYQGPREGWSDIEQAKKDATIRFMEYPSNHTILCKTRPSMRVNVSHDCSGEHLTPTAANPPWKDQTTKMNNEKVEQVKHSTMQAPWIQASTRLYDPVKPVNSAVDRTNYRSRRKTRIGTYLDSFRVHSSFRRVHPASSRSSSTHMVNELNPHPEAPVPPDEPTTLADIARSTHSLFHSNHGLGQRSTSSDLANENTTNGGVIGSLFPRHSIYAEVENYNLTDMGVDTCIVSSLLNTFELEVSSRMESDEDGSTVVSFVPKMATPIRLSRADVFGEDPPTPSSSSYHDADSQPLSACDFSRSQAESDMLGSLSNFVTEKSVTDFSCDFPRVIQLNTPHNDVEEFFTPSSPSTSSSTRATEEIDFAVATPSISQPTDPPQDLAAHLQCPRILILPPTTTIWHSHFPSHAFDYDRVNGSEDYRSQKISRIKEKMISHDARRRASNRGEEQGLIVEDELEQLPVGCSVQVLGSYVRAHLPFKRRKKDKEKGKNMAFVKVHIVEYDSKGRELLESRVERRQKVYIDDEEFEGSFPPIDRRWRLLDHSEHLRPRKRRPCWYNRISKKRFSRIFATNLAASLRR